MNHALEVLADEPLNLHGDQLANLDPQLRKLDLKLLLKNTGGVVSGPSSALLLGGAVGFLLRRNFAMASFFAAGLFLQQAFRRSSGKGTRKRSDIELERYALKAQRGDFGKLEVIPFR